MKKAIIATMIVMLISIILSCFMYQTQALGLGDPNLYIQQDDDNSGAVGIGNIIVGVIRVVGQSISVVMLAIIGIKYVMGSVEEKAEYKQTMWPYVLGAVLIFAGSAVTNIIYEMFNN